MSARPRRKISLDASSAERKKSLALSVRAPSVALDAEVPDSADPKWQHVASAGVFKGYGGGAEPFAFDETIFAQLVRNFRSNPSFEMGPDGVGVNGIVQWDFHHAAEASPSEVAIGGAPAQGWVRDLRVQQGANGPELWALTEWLEPAKTYIQEKKYKWASVAVALDAVDPVSGEQIGAVLTSIAITNLPFIEGMNELTASKEKSAMKKPKLDGSEDEKKRLELLRSVNKSVKLAYMAYSVDEAKNCIRNCLGLPITATAGEIVASIKTLAALMAGGEAAEEATGIDADKAIGDLRTTLGLPLLTMPDEVVRQSLRLFDTESTLDEPAAPAGGDFESTPGATTTATKKPLAQPQPPGVGSQNSEKDQTMTILVSLSKKLGVRETPEAVEAAVNSVVEVRDELIGALGLDRNVSDAKLAGAVKSVSAESKRRKSLALAFALVASLAANVKLSKKGTLRLEAEDELESELDDAGHGEPDADDSDPMKHPLIQKLRGLMTAGGVEDPDRAVSQIVKTLGDAAKLYEIEPEFKKLKSYAKEQMEAVKATAVSATLRDYFNGDEDYRDAIEAHYEKVGHKKFLEKYPASDDAPELSTSIAAEPNVGSRRSDAEPAAPPARQIAATRRGNPREEVRADVVDLSKFAGVNDSERAINAMRAQPGGDKLDFDTLCEMAFSARKEGRFVNLSARH